MSKVIITPINNAASPSGTSNINYNFQKIAEALENTLSRDGTLPNEMTADIDLNGNDLLNVNVIDAEDININGENLSARLQEVVDARDEAIDAANDSRNSANQSTASASSSQGYAEDSQNSAELSQAQVALATQEANRSEAARDAAEAYAEEALENATQLVIASQAEAEAGVSNTKGMTPLRTRQEINVYVPELAAPFIRQPEKYGFVGAASSPVGLVDSRTVLNDTITAAATDGNTGSREVIIRGNGYIGLSGPLTIRSGVRMICDGDVRFLPTVSNAVMIASSDPIETGYVALTADALVYRDRVVVGAGNTGSFTVNGYVKIRSQTLLPSPGNSQLDKCGQVAKVVYIDSTTGTLHLDRSLKYDYLVSATAEVCAINVTRDILFENFKWGLQGHSLLGGRMFQMRGVANARWSGIVCENLREQGQALNSFRSGLTFSDVLDSVVDGFQLNHIGWYGFSVGTGTDNLIIRNGVGHYMRHLVSLVYSGGGGGYGEPDNILVENAEAHYCDYAGFDSHDTGMNLTWRRCKAVGGVLDTGIQVRSRKTRIENCETHYNKLDGIGIEATADDCIVDGLKSYRNGRFGLQSAHPKVVVTRFDISDNGDGAASGRSGVRMVGGELVSGRLERNDGPAINYYSSDTYQRQPFLIRDVFAARVDSAKQDRFLSATRVSTGITLDLKNVTFVNNTGRDFTSPFLITGATGATTPNDMIRSGNRWTTTAEPNPPQTGRAVLVAGQVVVTAPSILVVNGGTSIPQTRPNIGLRFADPSTTEERLWVSAWTNGVGFTIKSSDVASTRPVIWEILD